MERRKVAALGGTAALGLAVGGISLDGVQVNLGEVTIVTLLVIALIALVVFMIISLVKGWVIVKMHYDTILARAQAAESANERLSDRQMILTQTNQTLVAAVEKNMATGDTVTKLVHSIQDARADAGGTT